MNQTTYLFSLPSLSEGFARVFDFGSTLNEYNDSDSGKQADLTALKSDWLAIGNDMREVINCYEKEQYSTGK